MKELGVVLLYGLVVALLTGVVRNSKPLTYYEGGYHFYLNRGWPWVHSGAGSYADPLPWGYVGIPLSDNIEKVVYVPTFVQAWTVYVLVLEGLVWGVKKWRPKQQRLWEEYWLGSGFLGLVLSLLVWLRI